MPFNVALPRLPCEASRQKGTWLFTRCTIHRNSRFEATQQTSTLGGAKTNTAKAASWAYPFLEIEDQPLPKTNWYFKASITAVESQQKPVPSTTQLASRKAATSTQHSMNHSSKIRVSTRSSLTHSQGNNSYFSLSAQVSPVICIKTA